jgi:pimeloyl-ACP methyl ester carboxylesterase
VILPGFATSSWTRGLLELTSSHRLHRLSIPGFCHDEPPSGIRSPLDLACVVKRELATRGLDEAPVLGHSFGGWVAAELACISHPERLVLVDAMGLRIKGEVRSNVFDRPREDVIGLVYGDTASAPEWSTAGYAGLARYGWAPYLCDPSLPNRLAVLDARTLVIWGADDQVVPPTHALLFAELIRGAQSEVIPAAGHDPTSEQPARFADVVRAFLAAEEAIR